MLLTEGRVLVRWAARDDESAATAGACCGSRAGDRVPARFASGRQHYLRAPHRRPGDGDAVAECHLATTVVDHVDQRVPTPGQEVGVVEFAVRDHDGLA